jgi:hypothetical protein
MPTPTSGSASDPVAREVAVAALLDRLPWHLGAVVIGGCAIAAHGIARRSVDVDFVTPAAQHEAHSRFLEAGGLSGRTLMFGREAPGGLVVERWEKAPATLDLLVSGVRDRKARIDVPAEGICREPWRGGLQLVATGTDTEVTVCRPAALFALKLMASRRQDLADLMTMDSARVDTTEIRALFRSLWCESLQQKLQLVDRLVADPKAYRDACSHRALGSPEKRENLRRWKRLRDRVAACTPEG